MIVVRNNTLPDFSRPSANALTQKVGSHVEQSLWGARLELGRGEAKDVLSETRADSVDFFPSTGLKPSVFNLVYRFPDDKTVVFNTLTESVAVMSNSELRLLETQRAISDVTPEVKQLYNLGMLVRVEDDERFRLNVIRSRAAFAPFGANSIVIYPTTGCNARCEYCFEEGTPKITMSSETVDKAIQYILRTVLPGDEVLFRWFGGEPLIAHDVITKICDSVRKAWGDEVSYSSIVTTNGSMISDDLINTATSVWRAKRFDLTLDGWASEHNARKHYLDSVTDYYSKVLTDIRKLLDAGLFVVCRINLDKHNFWSLDQVLRDLEAYSRYDSFYVQCTTLRPPKNHDANRYILFHENERAYEAIFRALYEHEFFQTIDRILPRRARRNCLARTMNEVIIGADGLLYKCEQAPMCPNNSVGTLDSGIVFNDVYKDWLDVSIDHEECRECPFLPICAGGCKHYWDEQRPDVISPCAKEKTYMNVIAKLVHEWVIAGRIAPRDDDLRNIYSSNS